MRPALILGLLLIAGCDVRYSNIDIDQGVATVATRCLHDDSVMQLHVRPDQITPDVYAFLTELCAAKRERDEKIAATNSGGWPQ